MGHKPYILLDVKHIKKNVDFYLTLVYNSAINKERKNIKNE